VAFLVAAELVQVLALVALVLAVLAAVQALGLGHEILNWEIGHAGDSGADFTAFGLTWDAKTSTLQELIFDDADAFKSQAAILIQMLGDRRHPIDGSFRVGGVCSRARFMRECESHDYGHGTRLRLHSARLVPVRQFLDETAIRSSWGLTPENDPVGSTESDETETANV